MSARHTLLSLLSPVVKVGYWSVAMPYRSVSSVDDGSVYIALGSTHSLSEREPLGELSCEGRGEGAARAMRVSRIYAAGTELYHLAGLTVVEDVDEFIAHEVASLEED